MNTEKLKELGEQLSGTLKCLEKDEIAHLVEDRSIIKNLINHQVKIVDAIIEDTSAIKECKIAKIKKLIRKISFDKLSQGAELNSNWIYVGQQEIERTEKELDDLLNSL